jgi:mono/diheme cytochrome c family protein
MHEDLGTAHPAVLSASHAARCVACHGVRSHPMPVALVGERSIQ